MNMKLIMNPGARAGRGRQLWPEWEAGLRQAGIPYEAIVTSGPGDAFRICREARGHQTLVAVGGDGTINEMLDGIMQSGNPDLTLGVLYSGTSPDFCRFHQIPTEPLQALTCLQREIVKKVDVARITYSAPDGRTRIAHFGCGCNIGLGAATAGFANRWRKWLGDSIGTGLGAVLAIIRSNPMQLTLDIDGRTQTLNRANHISILKNPHIASGLKLNVDLQSDDGKLMLAAVHGLTRVGLCRVLPGFYSGNAVNAKGVFMTACSRVSIGSENAQDIEFDGDPRGYLPIEIEIRPRALNLIGGA